MSHKAGTSTCARFQDRIEELCRNNAGVSPMRIMQLLKRAEANPSFDIEQELVKLKKQSKDT